MGTNIDNLLGVQPVDTTPTLRKRTSAIEALFAPEPPAQKVEEQADFQDFRKSLEQEFQQSLTPEFVEKEYQKRRAPSPFEPVSDSPLPTADFWTKVEELKDNPIQLVPFLSGGQDAIKYGKLLAAGYRYNKGEENHDDFELLKTYIEESEREKSFGYQVLNTISFSIPFALELAATGGLGAIGRAAILKGGKEGLKKIIAKEGKEMFLKKAAKFGVAKTIQTGAAGATRIWAGTQQKQLDSLINQIQTGEEKEDLTTSFSKAFGEQWVETLSEFSGGLLAPAQKYVGNRLLKVALFASLKKANPSMPVKVLQQFIEKTGWNGVVGEMFEERVGAAGHQLMNKAGLSDQKPPIIPSGEQLAIEFVAFSVPGIGLAAASKLFEREQKVGPGGMTLQDEEPEIIDFSRPAPPVAPPGVEAPVIPSAVAPVAPLVEKGVEEGIIQPPTREKPAEVKISPINIEFEPLAEEARKFKSVEEFVKAQNNKADYLQQDSGELTTLRHKTHTTNDFDTFINIAEKQLEEIERLSKEYSLPLPSKRYNNLKKQIYKKKDFSKINNNSKDNLNDFTEDFLASLDEIYGTETAPGGFLRTKTGFGSKEPSTLDFNTDGAIKDYLDYDDASQLTDIWNKAQEVKEAIPTITKPVVKAKARGETLLEEKPEVEPEVEGVVEVITRPFTEAEIAEAKEFNLDFTKVPADKHIEARQQLEFQKEEKANLERPGYSERVRVKEKEAERRKKEGVTFREQPAARIIGVPPGLVPKTVAWKSIVKSGRPTKTPDSWGNEFFQIRAELPKQLEKVDFQEITQTLESILPEELEPAEFVSTAKLDEKEVVGIKGASVERLYINKRYLDVVAKLLPDALPFVAGERKPVVFKRNDNVVAMIMPMLGDIEGITPLQPSVEVEPSVVAERQAEKKPKVKRAPSGVAAALSLPLGAFDKTSEKIGEYESDAQAINQGLKEYPNFKLYEKVQELIKKYAKTIGQGYTPRGALGVFYTETENIRVNGMNDLSVAAHEITHFLDKTYQISDKVQGIKGYSIAGNPIYEKESALIRKEMTDLYTKFYPGGKRKHKLKKRMMEGFATLLQRYAAAPLSTAKEFPKLVKEFLKTGGKYYHPIMGDIITDLREIVVEYQGLKPLDKINARIVDNEVNINKDDWLTTQDKIFTEMADEIYPIEKIAKITGIHFTKQDPSLWVRIYKQVGQFVLQNLNGKKGYWGWRGGDLVKLHDFNWGDLFRLLVSEKRTRDFNAWLVARNEHFLYKELAELEKLKDFENAREEQKRYSALQRILENDGFTKEEVDAAYKQGKNDFVKEAEMFDVLTREDLNFLHDPSVQLLNSEDYTRYTSREGYASLKRQFYDEVTGEGELPQFVRVGKIRVSSLTQRKGSQRPIISPLYSGISNHAEITKKGMRQIIYNRFADIAPEAPALFQKLQLKVVPDAQGRFLFPQEKDPNIIMARIDYKRVPILADKTIKRVLDEVMTPQGMNVLERIVTGASRFFTKGTTGLFPAFAITNTIRDQLTAWGLTRNKFIPLYDPLKKISKVFLEKNSPEARFALEFMVAGGDRMTFVTWLDMSPNELAIKLRNEKNGLDMFFDALNKGADVLAAPSKYSEIATRMTEYIKAREAGKSVIVAIEETARVSIPFVHIGRLGGGRLGKTIIKSIPFFNPGLQVLAQIYRNLDTNDSRRRMLFVTLIISSAEIASFALLAAGGDDNDKEQYKDLEARELSDSLWLPNPAGEGLIRLPVPSAFSAFGAIINMVITEGWLDADYSARDYLAAGTATLPSQLNPAAPIEAFFAWFPQIIKPATLALLNKQDFPRIRPLESQTQLAKTPGQRFTKGTSRLAKFVGQKLNLSPIKIDYLLTGYAGRVSQFFTGKPKAFDLLKGVHRDYYFTGGRRLQNYYDLKERNQQEYHDYTKRLLKYSPERIRQIKVRRERINEIEEMLDTYRDIDIEKQPERTASLRTRIIERVDALNEI